MFPLPSSPQLAVTPPPRLSETAPIPQQLSPVVEVPEEVVAEETLVALQREVDKEKLMKEASGTSGVGAGGSMTGLAATTVAAATSSTEFLPEPRMQLSGSGSGTLKRKMKMSQMVRHTPAGASMKDGRSTKVLAWGNYESRYSAERAALETELWFPEGTDVTVRTVKRMQNAVFPRLRPEQRFDRELESFVAMIIDEYHRDFLVVDHNSAQFGVAKNSFGSQRNESPNEFFATRKGSERKQTPTVPASTADAPLASGQGRAEVRLPTVPAAASDGGVGKTLDSTFGVEQVRRLRAFTQGSIMLEFKHFSHQRMAVSIAARAFKLTIGELEPLFCTMTLYDIERRMKLSEDFHFHVNSPSVITGCGLEGLVPISGQIKHAMMMLSGPSPHLYLVIKGFRLLRGEVDKDILALQKGKFDLKQTRTDIKEWVAHTNPTSLPLQPYLWAPLMLFTSNEGTVTLTQMHRSEIIYPVRGVLTDEAIYEALADEADRPKRLKSLPGVVEVDVTPVSDSAETTFGRLDPCFIPVEPFPRETEAKIQKELQDFAPPPHPYNEYLNNLYLYPESLAVKHGGHSHLQVSAQLVDTVTLLSAKVSPLDAVFPPLYNYTPALDVVAPVKLVKEAFSTVQWDESRPVFCDEFKIMLPPRLNNQSVLFTFYNVNPSGKSQRTIVGFAAVQVLRDDTILRTDRYHMLVCRSLSEINAQTMRPLPESESKKFKHVFTFRVFLASTIFPQDDAVVQFLRETSPGPHIGRRIGSGSEESGQSSPLMQSLSAAALVPPPPMLPDAPSASSEGTNPLGQSSAAAGGAWKGAHLSKASFRSPASSSTQATAQFAALAALEDATPVACAQFFYPIMRSLLRSVCAWSETTSREAFVRILSLLRKVFTLPVYRGTESENHMLRTYLATIFDPQVVSMPGKLLHELMAKYWVALLEAEHSARPKTSTGAAGGGISFLGAPGGGGVDGPFNWFLLELLAKSATVYSAGSKKLDTDTSRATRYSGDFQTNVCKLTVELLKGYSSALKSNDPTRGMPLFVNIRAVPLFINAMFPLVDRGLLLNAVYGYMSATDPTDEDPILVNTIKFTILKTLADYEHFVPLNIPVPFPVNLIDTVTGLVLVFWQRFPLVGFVLHEVNLCFTQRNPTNRQQGIKTLRDLLRKHATDPRYQSPVYQTRIASMYFPVLMMLIQDADVIGTLEDSQQHDILLCFLYVAKWCPLEIFKAWWNKDTQKRHVSFFGLLALTLEKFRDQPQQAESIQVACRYCVEFVCDRLVHLGNPRDPVFQAIYDVLILAFSEGSEPVLDQVIDSISTLLHKLPDQFFVFPGNSYIDGITYEVLKVRVNDIVGLFRQYANGASETQQPHVRSMVTLIALMLTLNYEAVHDTKRTKIQATLAASRLVVEETVDTEKLLRFFKMIDNAAASDPADAFRHAVSDVTSRITSLLNYHAKITSTRDPDTLSDLYYETALGYDESPDLRVTWLENLATKHAQHSDWEEAGQAKIFVALLVAQYLRSICHTPLEMSDFALLTPNLDSALTRIDIKLAHETGQLQSSLWNLEALVMLLKQACSFLVKAGLYENVIEVYSVLEAIFKREKNYTQMIETLSESTVMCKILVDKEKEREARLFARYYRVAFFGRPLEELDGRDFIYKRPATSNLASFQQQMKEFLSPKAKGGESNVVLLPNRTVDVKSLDSSKVYFQMVSVEPHFDGPEAESRISSYDRHFGSKKFIAVQAFTEEGRKSAAESMKGQKKKKTIFEVEIAFPFVKNRLAIIAKHEIVLEPIENAIELILERSDKIREQLESNPPKINPLQQVLQGSVVPMVNEGPLKICELFLSDEGRKAERPELVEKLCVAMANFLELCAAAIQLNVQLIGPRHIKFHEMIEKHYAELYEKILRFISRDSRRKVKRVFTKEDIDRKVWREQQKVTINLLEGRQPKVVQP